MGERTGTPRSCGKADVTYPPPYGMTSGPPAWLSYVCGPVA